jgi:hypothetical protein
VLFSDIDMPGTMNGLALGVHLRRVDTRIILTSGGEMPSGDAKEYASFLPKPYADTDVEHLLRSVEPAAAFRSAFRYFGKATLATVATVGVVALIGAVPFQ